MKYKAVVFDYAGVVAGSSGREFDKSVSKIIGVSIKTIKNTYYKYNDLHNTGKILWEELWDLILTDLDKTAAREELFEFIKRPKLLNSHVIDLIKDLKKMGYKIVLLSNYSKKSAEKIHQNPVLKKLFDMMIISAETGLAKPHPECYQDLIRRLELKPEEIIFVDDSIKNTRAAQKMGICTIHCKNTKKLKRQFTKLDIF